MSIRRQRRCGTPGARRIARPTTHPAGPPRGRVLRPAGRSSLNTPHATLTRLRACLRWSTSIAISRSGCRAGAPLIFPHMPARVACCLPKLPAWTAMLLCILRARAGCSSSTAARTTRACTRCRVARRRTQAMAPTCLRLSGTRRPPASRCCWRCGASPLLCVSHAHSTPRV